MNAFEKTLSAIRPARFTDPGLWAALGAQWPSGEQKSLHCCAVQDETHDVKTFVFQCPDLHPISFEPGQFLTVSPLINGQSVSRCYTISSSPARPFTFAITVKRVPGGPVSNWLHDNLRAGDRLLASGPAGNFTPVSRPSARVLYLSAGSGVTPLASMIRASTDLFADMDIVFIHSARTPKDIVFRDELALLAASRTNVRVINICEGLGDEPDWQGRIGRLDLELLQARVPDFLQREVFTCGPQGYMSAVQNLLQSAGFDMTHFHNESFDISAAESEPLIEIPATAAGQGTFTVKLARSGKTFSMTAGQTVLSAAKKAGAVVPSSCSQGGCGTCKTALLEGTVEMNHNGGIRQREIDRGLRLLCCSRPTSDLVIDL